MIKTSLIGHFRVVYSPDDDGYYADMWWDDTLDCPVYQLPEQARRWALKHGGKWEH